MARILIIDDNQTVRDAVDMVLRMGGFDTETAADGRDGLDKAHRRLPDVVVCDVEMPGMGGFETLESLRQDPLLHEVPVIFLTGRADWEAEGRRLGAQAVLAKPFNIGALIAEVTACVSRGAVQAVKSAIP